MKTLKKYVNRLYTSSRLVLYNNVLYTSNTVAVLEYRDRYCATRFSDNLRAVTLLHEVVLTSLVSMFTCLYYRGNDHHRVCKQLSLGGIGKLNTHRHEFCVISVFLFLHSLLDFSNLFFFVHSIVLLGLGS